MIVVNLKSSTLILITNILYNLSIPHTCKLAIGCMEIGSLVQKAK